MCTIPCESSLGPLDSLPSSCSASTPASPCFTHRKSSRASPSALPEPTAGEPPPSPRILIVARRMLRKGKWVDFVGEYHLDLVRKCGGIPIVVPRLPGMTQLLHELRPIHGVLLVEGEDAEDDAHSLSPAQREEVARRFSSDTTHDPARDELELRLCRLCLDENIPFLGICRGSQIMNKACGGLLYYDVATELPSSVVHLDPDNYDGHRHPLHIVPNTPLHSWMYPHDDIEVNSYHHQGIKRLADCLQPMAHAPDGLLEAYFHPGRNDPARGRFLAGLQFHPERMVDTELAASSDNKALNYQYPGCPRPFEDFVLAASVHRASLVEPNFDRPLRRLWSDHPGNVTRDASKLVDLLGHQSLSCGRQAKLGVDPGEKARMSCLHQLDLLRCELLRDVPATVAFSAESKLQALVDELAANEQNRYPATSAGMDRQS